MATRDQIKAYFQTGDTPTQAEFEEFLDSIPFLSEDNAWTGEQTIEKSVDASLEFNVINQHAGDNAGAFIAALSEVGNTTTKSTPQYSAIELTHGGQYAGFWAFADDASSETGEIILGAYGSLPLKIDSPAGIKFSNVPPEYADDAAAATGGVPVGGQYRTASVLKVRVA